MPRSVAALLVALGLVSLAGGQVAADGGIDAAGQVFFTFDFGGGGVESQGPRFGLRLGLQGDKSPSTRPSTPEPEPFISAMSLRFALDGPAEASLGGLTVPLGFNLFDESEDNEAEENGVAIDYASAAYGGGALLPERAPLVTAAEPTGQLSGQGLEAMVTPGAGTPQHQASATARWRFRALTAGAANVDKGPMRQVTAFSLRAGRPADAAIAIVERGRWHFRARDAGRGTSETSSFGPIARLLLRHLTGGGTTSRGAATTQTALRQPVLVAGRQDRQRQVDTSLQNARSDRWVFRPMVERGASDREMSAAAFDGNRLRSKRGHLPNR